jgi:capsular polysaccharide transport system permease protein
MNLAMDSANEKGASGAARPKPAAGRRNLAAVPARPAARENAPSRENARNAPSKPAVASPIKNLALAELRPVTPVTSISPVATRSRWRWLLFLVAFVVPASIGSLYYGFWASDQYVAEFRFIVRAPNDLQSAATGASGSSGAGAVGSSASALSIMRDSYVVSEYLRSRQVVEDLLSRGVDLRAMFSHADVDWWARFNPDRPEEDLVRYWRRMVEAYFDIQTGIVWVTIHAFAPNDAERLARELVALSEKLVNDMSMRARTDAVDFAKKEVERAAHRVSVTRETLRDFRARNRLVDPTGTAQQSLELAGKMKAEIARLNAELSTLRTYLSPDAPSVLQLRNLIKSLEQQMTEARADVGDVSAEAGDPNKLAELMAKYEALRVDHQVAQKFYEFTLLALDSAVRDAARQQSYIVSFVKPVTPTKSTYPNRPVSILIVIASCAAFWLVCLLVGYSIRDHMV